MKTKLQSSFIAKYSKYTISLKQLKYNLLYNLESVLNEGNNSTRKIHKQTSFVKPLIKVLCQKDVKDCYQ